MGTSSAGTPDEYVAELSPERREIVTRIREAINANLPPGYREGMTSGMIGWYVPLETFPDTYNGEPLGLAGLASQKQYVSLYLLSVYSDPATEAWFREQWLATGKPLRMGKSCVRFRRIDEVPLGLIGETIARADLDGYLARYREVAGSARRARRR